MNLDEFQEASTAESSPHGTRVRRWRLPAPRARTPPPRAPTLTGERLPSARGGPAWTRPERRCPGGARCVRTSTGPRPRGCGQPFPRHCRPRTCSSVAWSPGGGGAAGTRGSRVFSFSVRCAARSFLRRTPPVPPPSPRPAPNPPQVLSGPSRGLQPHRPLASLVWTFAPAFPLVSGG